LESAVRAQANAGAIAALERRYGDRGSAERRNHEGHEDHEGKTGAGVAAGLSGRRFAVSASPPQQKRQACRERDGCRDHEPKDDCNGEDVAHFARLNWIDYENDGQSGNRSGDD
jgi:hypothetical protein